MVRVLRKLGTLSVFKTQEGIQRRELFDKIIGEIQLNNLHLNNRGRNNFDQIRRKIKMRDISKSNKRLNDFNLIRLHKKIFNIAQFTLSIFQILKFFRLPIKGSKTKFSELISTKVLKTLRVPSFLKTLTINSFLLILNFLELIKTVLIIGFVVFQNFHYI